MFAVLCRHAHSDWQSTESYYVIGKSNIMQTWKHIIALDIKGKHNFKHFYYTHILEIPTNKGAKSNKLKHSKIGNCCSLTISKL